MILYPNCKINIGLRIVRKREDGYHDLETIFYPVYGLHDQLEVNCTNQAAHDIDFQFDGITVDCSIEDNLVVRCYRQMAQRHASIGSVRVGLSKHIPYGAGLGGGSSDAAHMALALNELFQLHLSPAQLAEEVRPLGADCPFFIYNTPCFAEGIGDQLQPISLSLKGMRLIMVKPPISVSTKAAYAGISARGKGVWDMSQWKQLTNDFEQTVFEPFPLLASIKQNLLDAGAIYAAMSGSGSTIYGLFEHDTQCSADTYLRRLDKDFASMVIFNDTLA